MRKLLTIAAIALLSVFFQTTSFAKTTINRVNGINPKILRLAMNGYYWALKQGKVSNTNVITVIDYTKPSYEKRMWVINLRTGQVLLNTRVTHGQNSGVVTSTRFSNLPESKETSLGVFTTADIYYGKHGKSMRLHGLQRGFNDNAWRRAIVFHPATYASEDYLNQKGYLGRSWGCIAVDPKIANRFMSLTRGGSVIFAYAKPIERSAIIANRTEFSDSVMQASADR